MQICHNEECEFYSKKIIDSCANETLCNIGECENYLKTTEAHSSVSSSAGLDGQMEERSGWISVEDRLPSSTEIECWTYVKLGQNLVTSVGRYGVQAKRWYLSPNFDAQVIAWMPLPEPPKAA